MLVRRLLAALQSVILAAPLRVLAGAALVTVLAVVLATGVELRTSRSELAPAEDPEQRRFSELLARNRASEALVVCVESEPGGPGGAEGIPEFADRLAAALVAEPLVAGVFHRVDVAWLREKLLYVMAPRDLARLTSTLESEAGLLGAVGAGPDLASWLEAVAERLERGHAAAGAPPPDARAGAMALATALGLTRQLLEQPRETVSRLEAVVAGTDGQGYLKTRDGSTYFLLVTPASDDDSLAAQRALLAAVRARVERVRGERPGFRVAFTGNPALVVEEMEAVRADTWTTSIVSAVGVTLLTFLVFRWRAHAVLVLVALAVGVAWSFGAVRLELGYLNLITSSFVSTLVGIGVAYGIHPVSEYELEGAHTRSPLEAVRVSFHRTGAAVATAAFTTAAAFLSVELMGFRGFSELGLVAGVGVLLCLAAALVVLPALLAVHGRWRQARERSHRPAAFVDRFWVERIAGRVCAYPRSTVAAGLVATAIAGWAAIGLGFDSNILALLPADAESLRYQRRLLLDSDLAPLYGLGVAESVEELASMRDAARAETAIARVESVLDFVPDDPAAATAAVRRLGRSLGSVRLPAETAPLVPGRLAAALGRVEAALGASAEAAFGTGFGEVAAALEAARVEAAQGRGLAERASPAVVAEWNRAQARVLAAARAGLDTLARAAAAEPPTLADLPQELRERFVLADGRLLALLHPAGSVFVGAELDAFVAAARRVAPDVTGFPVVFQAATTRITSGFGRATIWAAALIVLILVVDLRSPREAALALLPLAVGMIWMLGAMRLVGQPFTFANLVGIPLVLGVGVDNGVHVIHRLRLEGRDGIDVVLRHTGRAILIASLTAMIGFGALMLASHRGLRGLGTVLFLGVGTCLLAATLLLPNVLVTLGLVARGPAAAGRSES